MEESTRLAEIRRSVAEKQRRVCEMLQTVGTDNLTSFALFTDDSSEGPEVDDKNPENDTVFEEQIRWEPPGYWFSDQIYQGKSKHTRNPQPAPSLNRNVPKNQEREHLDETSSTEPDTSLSDGSASDRKDITSRGNASQLDDTSKDDRTPDLELGDEEVEASKTLASENNEKAGSHSKQRSLCCCIGKKGLSDYDEHLGEGRQYWRDIILGVNDGLVSTFLLVAGVTGAHLSNTDILLTAVSGTIAGAISMAAGEYVATKTQEEVLDGEIRLERKHIQKNRDEELEELSECFTKIGIPDDEKNEEATKLRRHLMAYYKKDDEAHLQVHAVLELGDNDERRNPVVAGCVAFFLFFFGALPSVIPFAVTGDSDTAFIVAAVATTTGLFLVGAIKTWATRGSLMGAALENLIIAAGGGAIAYGVGVAFDKLIRGGGWNLSIN